MLGGGGHRLGSYESMEEKLAVSESLGSVSMSLGDPAEPDRGLLSLAEELSVEQVAGCELASVLQDTMERYALECALSVDSDSPLLSVAAVLSLALLDEGSERAAPKEGRRSRTRMSGTLADWGPCM